MKISIIVAIAEENAIGNENKLLCHLPNDLKWFKKNTTGCKVIMGRNTLLSLPNGALPNRENIVITDKLDNFVNCTIVNSVEEAIQHFDTKKENFIIGGASIYKQFLPLANKLYLTKIHHKFAADAFFPEIDYKEWRLIEKTENQADEKHLYDYSFEVWERE
jgi:dihydrofolate reductase